MVTYVAVKPVPPAADQLALDILRIFLISFFGSIVLEYTTSYVLEKLFHAVWWDYSDLPLNIHGRVSFFTTLGFGVVGPIAVYGIIPPIERAGEMLPSVATELLALVLTALGTADITLTVAALTDFERNIISAQDAFNDRMDSLVENVQSSMSLAHQAAVKRVRGFRYPRIPAEHLAGLIGEIRKRF